MWHGTSQRLTVIRRPLEIFVIHSVLPRISHTSGLRPSGDVEDQLHCGVNSTIDEPIPITPGTAESPLGTTREKQVRCAYRQVHEPES
jgi:hypothetical protein